MAIIKGQYSYASEDVKGTSGDDTFLAGAGDNIDGGLGTDTALFYDAKNNFSYVTLAGVTQVKFLNSYMDEKVTLTNVEQIQFSDSTVNLNPINVSIIKGQYSYASEDVTGSSGNDIFLAGAGDNIDGGLGTDTVLFYDSKNNFSYVTLAGVTQVKFLNSYMDEKVILTNVEQIQFTDGVVNLGVVAPTAVTIPSALQPTTLSQPAATSHGMNITTNFPSLASLNDARTAVLSTSLPLISALNYSHQAYNNAFTYSYSTYDARSSSKVAGTLTNGDYGVAYGSSLTAYPSTLTQGDYTFANSNVTVNFYGSVSQANAYAYKTGYLDKIIVSSGQAKVSMDGYVGVSANNGGTLTDFTVQNGQVSLAGVGDFNVQGTGNVFSSYQSSISGTLSSLTLSSGSNAITIGGSIDLKSLSSYSSFTDFLASTMNGNDNVTGTNASEYLMGYAGNDYLSAGYGDDTLDGGTGNDILDGGLGTNTAIYTGYKSSYIVSQNGSIYTISSLTDGTDTLNNIQFLKFADGVVAIDSALPITQTPPALVVVNPSVIETPKSVISTKSTSGDDQLTGTAKNDKLSSLEGNDTLIGGLGADVLTGGLGTDVFKFNDIKETGLAVKTRDTITDFKTSEGDKIDLSGIDANTNRAGDQAFTKLDIGAKFSGKFSSTGQLFFDTTTQILWGNVDTKAGADFSIQLNGVSSLVATDFVL
ncbi:MAG: type I secretion C-terminal target domain-containing protein, partial [Methylococcaceae bacterium]